MSIYLQNLLKVSLIVMKKKQFSESNAGNSVVLGNRKLTS